MTRRFATSTPSLRTDRAGAPERLLHPPRVPIAGRIVSRHVVQPGDRLDTLAARYLGDPDDGWRILDANPTLDPAELLEPGRVLLIPEERR